MLAYADFFFKIIALILILSTFLCRKNAINTGHPNDLSGMTLLLWNPSLNIICRSIYFESLR